MTVVTEPPDAGLGHLRRVRQRVQQHGPDWQAPPSRSARARRIAFIIGGARTVLYHVAGRQVHGTGFVLGRHQLQRSGWLAAREGSQGEAHARHHSVGEPGACTRRGELPGVGRADCRVHSDRERDGLGRSQWELHDPDTVRGSGSGSIDEAAGRFHVTAQYSGDSNYKAGSTSIRETVN